MNKYIITISVFLITIYSSCFKPKDYEEELNFELIKITSADSTVIADGASSMAIHAVIDKSAAPGKRKVVFKTSLGSFKGGKGDSIEVEANEKFEAIANLVSVKSGTATVSASILQIKSKNSSSIVFEKAFPDKLDIKVDSFVVYNNFGSEVLITASLSANKGKPSTGHIVSFSAEDEDRLPIGFFLNNVSTGETDADGKVMIRFSAGPSVKIGPIALMAETIKQDGGLLRDTTIIQLAQQ